MPAENDSVTLHQAQIWMQREVAADETIVVNARDLFVLCYLLAVADNTGIPVRLQECGQPAFGRALKALRGKR